MTEPIDHRGSYWSGWSGRVAIVALGLTLGLGAKWIRQTWEYLRAPPAMVIEPARPGEGQPAR